MRDKEKMARRGTMTMGTRRPGCSSAVGLVVMMASVLVTPMRVPAPVAAAQLRRLPRPPLAAGMARVSRGVPPTVVYAWGFNQYGQLGIGSLSYSNMPLAVSTIGGVVALAGGGNSSLALKRDGTVWAWGPNGRGELGPVRATCATRYARFPCSDVPVQVRGLGGVVSVSAGSGHALALKGDGTVWAWGSDDYGELGDGVSGTGINRATPARVPGLAHMRAIAAGTGSSLAVAGDGTVWAWGANIHNREDGTNNSSRPLRVPGLRDVVAVAGDFEYGLALRRDGTVWAWGTNGWGEQGDGHVDDSFHATPGRILHLTDIVAIASGGGGGLALARDGTVWAWGSSPSDAQPRPLPARVRGLPPVTAIAAGAGFDLALARDGRVWAWGGDDYGELGNGRSGGDSITPVLVQRLTHVVAIAAGGWHGLALRVDVSARTRRAMVSTRPAPSSAR